MTTDAPRSLDATVDRRRVLRTAGAVAGATALLATPGTRISDRNIAKVAAKSGGNTTMLYHLEGRLLEVCTCNTLCPCWVGEDPDGGICDSVQAWQIDLGTIEGIDVTGRTLALAAHIPGNVLAGNWKAVIYVDDQSSEEQQAALLRVFTGQLGGPVADLAGLISDVVAVERAPIAFDVTEGKGTLTIGSIVEAELAPFRGATGALTTLNDTAFSTIPGAPAYPSKASHYRRDDTGHGLSAVNVKGQNAVQGYFKFEA
jgi:hypothetical protein